MAKSFHLPESKALWPRDRRFRTEHIKIDLRLDFEEKRIAGVCTLRLSPVGAPSSVLELDACGMEVRKVTAGGEPCEFEYDGRTISARLPRPLARSSEVRVEYGTKPDRGVFFTGPDAEFPGKEVQAWSHNEAEFARYWFPCFDDPRDKCTTETVITVPRGFRVISNGALVSQREDSEGVTFHWKEDIPHSTYLTSFVAGRFGEIRQEVDGVVLTYNFPESKREDALRYFGETPKMLKVFGEVTGVKYPYPKYAQTTVEDFIFGGMENFNATTLAMNYYPSKESEEDFAASYGTPHVSAVNLVAHELAHQWFGDLVTCSYWPHAWLNEGFATYMQGLYIERSRGVDAMRWDLGLRAQDYFDEDADDYRRPIVENDCVFPDDLFDETLYKKGGWMIHELRYLMGDEAFFAGLARYFQKHSLGSADTHDFRKAMEEASGLSLEEFFDQSFYRPGYPEFKIDYAWDDSSKTANVRVRQVQGPEGRWGPYKLPCDLVFYFQGGRAAKRVAIQAADQTFSFALEARPSIVEFDPEHWLLKKASLDLPSGMLSEQLANSRDATSRADAAVALGAMKAGEAVPGLAAAASKEQFWHVRYEALAALGMIGTEKALRAVLDLGVPSDRYVRRGLAKALGFFKDPRARELLLKLLKEDPSPYVRCEAALSIAKAWPEGAAPHLMDAMKSTSPNETLAEACLDALGKVDSAETRGVVMASLKYGRPTRVRIGAMKAIKNRGHLSEEEVGAVKGILLGDKDFRVRQYAASKLMPALADARFLETLKAVSQSDRDPRIRRKALEVFHGLEAAASGLEEVAKLRRELAGLKQGY